jgi:O-6-methylguanine DNA methyltransferase
MKLDRETVYSLTRQVPRGRVTTYGAIARAAGNPRAARGVGMLMHVNPDAPTTPCHRVVYSDGRIGGYGSKLGVEQKIGRLKGEGVKIMNGHIINFGRIFFDKFQTQNG